MSGFYEQHYTDLLKEALILSGAANKFLHRSNKSEAVFFAFKTIDLYFDHTKDNKILPFSRNIDPPIRRSGQNFRWSAFCLEPLRKG